MDLAYVKKLIKLVEESSVHELELDEKGVKIRISKSPNNQPTVYHAAVGMPMPQPSFPAPAGPVPETSSPAEKTAAAPPGKAYHEVKSPIVGTFYRAPAPDAATYVEVGSRVSQGTVLCIVEAMKLMNEIESDVAGTVVKIMVENGQPVEYGQVLFLVEAA